MIPGHDINWQIAQLREGTISGPVCWEAAATIERLQSALQQAMMSLGDVYRCWDGEPITVHAAGEGEHIKAAWQAARDALECKS